MPIYEFECPVHGRFARIIPLSLYERTKEGIACESSLVDNTVAFCSLRAKKLVSRPANIQLAPSTKVFINPRTGESQIAVSSSDRAPYGFIEKELKGPVERSKFEKEDTAIQNAINEYDQFRMETRTDATRKARHDDLKARMNAKQVEVVEMPDGKIERVEHHLEPIHKKLLGEAMTRTGTKRIPKKTTERMFAVNHTDHSNLQDAPMNPTRAKK